MERMTGAPTAKEPQLTPRQRDILRLIVKGQRMKEIASNLGLSTRTVEGHKYEMMETLGVTSTAELVRYALDRGSIWTRTRTVREDPPYPVVFRVLSSRYFCSPLPAAPQRECGADW